MFGDFTVFTGNVTVTLAGTVTPWPQPYYLDRWPAHPS